MPTKKCKGKAYYTLTFNAEWSNETHPSPVFPQSAMFSPLIGATHNMYYEIWRRGKMASPGVQTVAETGRSFSSFGKSSQVSMNVLYSNKIVLELFGQYFQVYILNQSKSFSVACR